MDLNKIVKNKYFIPVLVGVIIAGVGILIGVSEKGNKSATGEEGQKKIPDIELKSQKSFKSLLFGEKEYDIAYADMDASSVKNIAFFEAGENWQGAGFLDWRTFYQGKSSLAVTSNGHHPGIVYLEKSLDLSGLKIIEFYVSLNDIQSLESVVVKFGDSSLTNYYSYPLSNLRQGWNFIRIPREQFISHKAASGFGWKDIKRVQFEVVSRPNATVIANFDYLAAQKNTDYLDKWNVVDDNFLSLGKENGKIALLARNEGALQATLAEGGGDNFSYQASFVPKTNGAIGLFFRGNYGNNRGYYFLADGINRSSCTLKKLGSKGWKNLATANIVNFVFEKDQKYWLRVEAKGKKLTGFLSVDGKNFTEVVSANDDEFSTGGVGIAVFSRGYGFFDDFKFRR